MAFDWLGAGNLTLSAANFFRGLYNDRLNWDWTKKNYDLAGQQFDWEKAKQMEAWNREDNAVQRRVADLKAAGINPLLAAGSAAAASSPAPVNAPQMGKRDISQSIAALDAVRQARIENLQTKAMREEIENKRKEREEADARIAKAKAEAAAITAKDTREGEMHKHNVVIAELEAKFKTATRFQREEMFKNEVKRSDLTNSSIHFDNLLRQADINVRAFDSRIRKVEADIAERFGMSNAEARNAVELLTVQMIEIDKGMKERENDFFERLGIPHTVRSDIKEALVLSAGIAVHDVRDEFRKGSAVVYTSKYTEEDWNDFLNRIGHGK